MGSVQPLGRPLMVGSCDSERWVFTMHVPSFDSSGSASITFSFSCAAGVKDTPSAPYTFVAIRRIRSESGVESS